MIQFSPLPSKKVKFRSPSVVFQQENSVMRENFEVGNLSYPVAPRASHTSTKISGAAATCRPWPGRKGERKGFAKIFGGLPKASAESPLAPLLSGTSFAGLSQGNGVTSGMRFAFPSFFRSTCGKMTYSYRPNIMDPSCSHRITVQARMILPGNRQVFQNPGQLGKPHISDQLTICRASLTHKLTSCPDP